MDNNQISKFQEFAEKANKVGSEILLNHFSNISGLEKWKKSDEGLVTSADIESDNAIQAILSRSEIKILSEESTSGLNESNLTWLVDPLCGTMPFSTGMPYWGLNIALRCDQQLLLSVVSLPYFNEIFVSILGRGVTLNGEILERKAPTKNLSDGIIGLEIDGGKEWEKLLPKELSWLTKVNQVNTFASAAYPLTQVCQGRLAAVVFYGIESVHIAAGALLATELGLKVTDDRNNGIDWKNEKENRIVVVGWPEVHNQLITRMQCLTG